MHELPHGTPTSHVLQQNLGHAAVGFGMVVPLAAASVTVQAQPRSAFVHVLPLAMHELPHGTPTSHVIQHGGGGQPGLVVVVVTGLAVVVVVVVVVVDPQPGQVVVEVVVDVAVVFFFSGHL